MDPNTSSPAPKNNTMMYVIGVVVLLLIGIGAVYAMNRGNNTQSPSAQDTTSQPTTAQVTEAPTEAMSQTSTTPEVSGAMTSSVKEITVSGKSFAFTPSTITVNKGDKVKIIFKNTGGFHDFVIDEFNVETPTIQSGQEATAEFTADKAGTFEYYCGVGNHRQMGMKGTLVVK